MYLFTTEQIHFHDTMRFNFEADFILFDSINKEGEYFLLVINDVAI